MCTVKQPGHSTAPPGCLGPALTGGNGDTAVLVTFILGQGDAHEVCGLNKLIDLALRYLGWAEDLYGDFPGGTPGLGGMG